MTGEHDAEAPPDGSISLIADLLSRCLDSVGPGGWLLNDSLVPDGYSDTGDILAALKLEVSAALEGIEEAVMLDGFIGEFVRYGNQRGIRRMGKPPRGSGRLVTIPVEDRESQVLPLGLKAKQLPQEVKVVSGGEVLQRSSRDIGNLLSQQVGAYSLERLAL
jgi:hypothetical protein